MDGGNNGSCDRILVYQIVGLTDIQHSTALNQEVQILTNNITAGYEQSGLM